MKYTIFLIILTVWSLCEVFSEEREYNITRIKGFQFAGGDFSQSLDEKVDQIMNKESDIPGLTTQKEIPHQIVVGHSQGGLKAMGYMQKMKNGYQENIDAVISVDSPIVGFAGLDAGYGVMRRRVLDSIKIFERGAAATLRPSTPVSTSMGKLYDEMPIEFKLNVFIYLYDTISKHFGGDGFPMKELFDTIINTIAPCDAIREITDMGPQSDFVRNNIQEKDVRTERYVKKRYLKPVIKWRFGVPHVYFLIKNDYGYRTNVTITSKVPDYAPIGHIVGTDNDPIRLSNDEDKEKNIRIVVSLAQVVFYHSAIRNESLALSFHWFPPIYNRFHTWARDSFRAADWCGNYKERWGDLIGGRNNDGFIAVATQTLPGTDPLYIRALKVDHARSNVPPEDQFFSEGDFGGEPLKKDIYGKNGRIVSILHDMNIEGF